MILIISLTSGHFRRVCIKTISQLWWDDVHEILELFLKYLDTYIQLYIFAVIVYVFQNVEYNFLKLYFLPRISNEIIE